MRYLLFESAAGIAVFSIKEFDDVAKFTAELQRSITDGGAFSTLVKLSSFHRFSGNEDAAAVCAALQEGTVPETVLKVVQAIVKGDSSTIGVVDERLKISLDAAGIPAEYSSLMVEISRGIKRHFLRLMAGDVSPEQYEAACLGLAHLMARNNVSYDKNRADNMVIQGVGHYETVLKNTNSFFMRLQEWYSYHFPELKRIMVDHHEEYVRTVLAIQTKEKLISGETADAFNKLVSDGVFGKDVAEKVRVAATISTGMKLHEDDLKAVLSLAKRTLSMFDEKQALTDYLGAKIAEIAPNTAVLLGDIPASRLIARAGGIRSLAKSPASTIQILGAEKALFRSLKARNRRTPKYGVLFSAPQVSKVDIRHKGRVARNLACSIARTAKMDCYGISRDTRFGTALKNMLEDRITFYKTGTNPPRKNIDLMMELYPSGSSTEVPVQNSTDSPVNEEKSSGHKKDHKKEHKKDDKKEHKKEDKKEDKKDHKKDGKKSKSKDRKEDQDAK